MNLRRIVLAAVCSLPFSLSLSFAVRGIPRPNQPCQAYLDTSRGIDDEKNNCPITVGNFSIRVTFSNSNWQTSFWGYEPAYYILYVKNKQNGSRLNLTGFNVMGRTSRPQYRFTDTERNVNYIVTFRYSDPNTLGLEIYQNNREIANELLARESNQLIGGP